MTKSKTTKKISAEEFDRKFDAGEDISDYIDWSKTKQINAPRRGVSSKRINLDIPEPMLEKLDKASANIGITRQSLIKAWLNEKLLEQR
jgi:predicted DNA binding CopG/RHH family protein